MLSELFLSLIIALYLSIILFILFQKFNRKLEIKKPVHFSHQPSKSNSENLIELQNVEKTFEQPVLKGIDLVVRNGETLGILGQSGSGKTVTLKLIAGLLRPDSGHILFKGEDIISMDEMKLLQFRKHVSYIFQRGGIFDFVNVRENVAYPLREMGITDEQKISKRVDYLLDAVEMSGLQNLQQNELSTGSKKQAAIARAVANNPEVILYDEPTTGLDPIVSKSLSHLIRKLNKQEKLTSVVVTHDLKCIEMVADRIILLRKGLIHFEGDQGQFNRSSDPFVQAFRSGKPLDKTYP
jgi:phospholipid/cholesterol/gamma-HCH transport system ATP-binding protein